MTSRWSAANLPRMDGKRIVVTGATNGIGWETARGLARVGAQVVLAVRDLERGKERAAQLASETAGARTEVVELDVADLASVRRCAEGLGQIDSLINNAGVMAREHTRTVDGFEMCLGTNFLGPFAFTNLLLPHIADRVVIVGSTSHKTGTVRLDDPHFERRAWSRPKAYSQSKLADMLWALELDRRLRAAGSGVSTAIAHPGWATTGILGLTGIGPVDKIIEGAGNVLANSPAEGAALTLYALTPDVPSGAYVGPDGRFGLRGGPTFVGRTPAACDFRTAGLLWELAESATGTRFAL
ncbi:SDR family NAD(P)-dependent oxidoreductase [Williamsia soli]|uniref:SDR family NAD(P)-dependent oxidoreductase n=1 Tax=Williamsia soli TaxID=364929 RepID=UPI001A9EC294|nr:SDR family NAD(P)-dependent oxidoreductase [Williamsia soli]